MERTPQDRDAAHATRIRLGRAGGQARARNMTPAERSAAARHAITSRWDQGDSVEGLEGIALTVHAIGGRGIPTVNARHVHAFLRLKKDYSDWIKEAIKRAHLVENRDFVIFPLKGENPHPGRPAMEYHVTVDAAKHIAMMSHAERGWEVREYFIQKEKELRDLLVVSSYLHTEDQGFFAKQVGPYEPGRYFTLFLKQEICRVYGQRIPQSNGEPDSPMLKGFQDRYIYGALPTEVRTAIRLYNPRLLKEDGTTGNRPHKVYTQLTEEKLNEFLKVRIDQILTTLGATRDGDIDGFRRRLARDDRRRNLPVTVHLSPSTTMLCDLLCEQGYQLALWENTPAGSPKKGGAGCDG